MADWASVADEFYGAAGILLTEQAWRSAVNRAYYAVFARACSALEAKVTMPTGWDGPKHKKLPDLIRNNLGQLRERLRVAEYISTLYEMRRKADYVPASKVEDADAHSAVGMMGKVFKLLKEGGL